MASDPTPSSPVDVRQAAFAQSERVQWIVNDNAELGVMVDGVAYFLYKGDSLIYADAEHDDGSPMRYRLVGKREFGECAYPINYADPTRIGTVNPDGDGRDWHALPAFSPTTPAPPIKGDEREMLEALAATLARLPDDTPGEARLYLDLTHGDGRLLRGTLDTILRHRTDTADAGEVDYEVWQADAFGDGDAMVAGSTGLPDAQHYAAVYGQDGPTWIVEVTRRRLTPSPEARETR